MKNGIYLEYILEYIKLFRPRPPSVPRTHRPTAPSRPGWRTRRAPRVYSVGRMEFPLKGARAGRLVRAAGRQSQISAKISGIWLVLLNT